jgi:uncharacterized iron-regulated membrane protein
MARFESYCVEPTRFVRWTEAALLGIVVIVGVFGAFRLLYVLAATAPLVAIFTANDLWWAWKQAQELERPERADADAVKRSQRIAVYFLPAFDLLLLVGAFGALVSWRPGAFLMVTGAVGLFVTHLFIGISVYREAMNRPWPSVRPLPDDDDDW